MIVMLFLRSTQQKMLSEAMLLRCSKFDEFGLMLSQDWYTRERSHIFTFNSYLMLNTYQKQTLTLQRLRLQYCTADNLSVCIDTCHNVWQKTGLCVKTICQAS